MGQKICYLYEYRESVPVRNVGFVRVEPKKEESVFEICAKGISIQGREQMEICGFQMKHGICKTVLIQTAQAIHGNLLQTVETEEKLEHLDGILLQCEGKVRFAAVWGNVNVNFTECAKREECQDGIEKSMAEEKPLEECALEEKESESPEEQPKKEVLKVEKIEGQQVALENPMSEQSKEIGLRCRKIQRNDLGELARKEWRLANNSFLLHGYYNYHHLLLIEDGTCCVLGVPGIYHRKERQAAECFGFSEFKAAEELPVTLSRQERNDYERFGYWCRRVENGK